MFLTMALYLNPLIQWRCILLVFEGISPISTCSAVIFNAPLHNLNGSMSLFLRDVFAADQYTSAIIQLCQRLFQLNSSLHSILFYICLPLFEYAEPMWSSQPTIILKTFSVSLSRLLVYKILLLFYYQFSFFQKTSFFCIIFCRWDLCLIDRKVTSSSQGHTSFMIKENNTGLMLLWGVPTSIPNFTQCFPTHTCGNHSHIYIFFKSMFFNNPSPHIISYAFSIS